jgi:DNA-directed RNA polymerase specialized sigma24 family protein
MPEDDLESALAADLDGSFERLVLAFQDRLYGFVLRYTGSPEDAEEVVQDALIGPTGRCRRTSRSGCVGWRCGLGSTGSR